MRYLILSFLVIGFLFTGTVFAADCASPHEQAQGQKDWRYTFHNGEWWYWLPENRWVYWRANRWNDYDPSTYVAHDPDGASSVPPYYGHAGSTYGYPPSSGSDETGPFYGHAGSTYGYPPSGGDQIGPYYPD